MTHTVEHGDPRQERKPMQDLSRNDMQKVADPKRPAPGMAGPATRGHRLAEKAPSCCG